MSNIALGLYKYVDGVNDTPFPSSANQAFLVDWQYGARRMGGAPSITGGTINHTVCLDNDWSMDVYVEYKGEKFFSIHKPTSSYSAQSITYEHKVDFYSERLVLDNVYFYDVVSSGDSGGKPVSNSTKFTFFGNITEFIVRLNASMQRANTGYSAVLDPNQANADLEKQIKFDTKYISEALQEGFKAFGIPYYFVGKVCHYGDSQSSVIDNIVFEYGQDKSLMSIEKTNANTKIINRITGFGSSDNIPYYYPNSCEQGVVDITNLSSSTITDLEIFDDMLFAKKVKRDAVLTYNLWNFNVDTPIFYLDGKAYKNGKGFTSDEIAQEQTLHVVVPFEVKYDGCTSLFMRFSVRPVATTISNLSLSPAISGVTPTAENGMVYINALNKNIAKGRYQLAFDVNISTFSLIMQIFQTESCTIYAEGWKDSMDGNFYKDLEEIGIMMTGTARAGDNFKQIISKYIPPQSNLMPSIYRNSDGDERFYNAANNTYLNPDTGEYYEFPNPYANGKPKEFIKDYKDVKPTISGAVNSASEPIDQIIKFAFDENDNDDLEEDGVTYKHPYFFALLHKTNGTYGFNLFDHAIDENEMSLSFTSGRMGGCEFVIGVGEDSQKNTVQIVLDANLQPELDEDGHPILLRDENGNVVWGREEQGKQIPQDWQNDTRRNEVWVALKKDTTTYGVIMPNATNNYRPSDDEVNEFVILHIDLPKAYILAAEQSIDNLLISYMAESNTEHWNFGIDFSRIYLKDTPNIATALDENKKIKIRYNGEIYSRYVLGYTYKTLIGEPLPSISIELAESLEGSSSALDTAINEINNMVEQQAQAMIGYQQIARLARGALQTSNVEGAGSSTRPIYFDGHEAKVVDGLEVPESIRTQKNVEAMWGVSSRGIATLETAGAGGGGTVTGINFAGSPSQIYTPSAGLITLPDYPSLDGYATQNWVTTNFADKAYESRVIAIESLIPAQATSSNQLADKAFVNSSIATNTATFRGTYESVADLPDSTDIPDLKNNDYAFVIGLVSSNPEYKRYKYTNGSWAYEYTLNNSSFTAAQWASITSGITSDKVSAYDTHIVRTDNPHSVTKAQVGLGNVENTKLSTWAGTANITTLGTIGTGIWHGTAIADDYIASAAAWNAKYDKPSGGIPKTDLASAVQTSLGKADTALQSHQTIYNLIIKKNGTQVGSTYNPATAAQTIDITDVASANALSGVSTRVGTLEGRFDSDGLLKKANHYSPASDSSADYSASASGATAAWSIDVVKAVQIQRDAKGHVLGVTVTNGKIPAKPTYAFSDLTSHPTTLSGYGITDGVNGLQKSGSGYLSGVDFVEGNPHSLYFTFTSFAKAQIGHTGGSGTTTYKMRVKADGAWSDYLALQQAGASAWGIVTDQAQTFGGDKTFNGNIHGMKGVSARGIATLEMAGGGGAGTVTSIQFGSGTVISANNGLLSVSVGQGTSNGQIKIGGQDISVKGLAALAYLPSLAFGDLTTHPTTLGDYGITDAKIENGVITLGSNSITPLTSHQTLYNLVINNSAGTAQITYKPAVSGTYALTLTKAMVGLSNVENTKLSTWTGSANITTLGTITTGKWQGTAIADSYIASATTWNAKQDAISDLSTIRSRADEGHTAYGWGNHANAGYFAASSFTKANIKSTLEISDWALAASKPSYAFSEITGTASDSQIPTLAISKISGLQTALDGKLATSLKGVANGLAELDANGLVPSSQLPSYVDDVLEYSSKSAFPATGTAGKIYVALDTNLTYRWSGSAYTEISPSLALGETSSTAYRGDRGKTAYDHATDASRLTTAKSSGFYKFATTAEGHIASVTAVTASDLTSLIGSTTYAPYNSAGYLPLSGGSISGTDSTPLVINTTWQSVYIPFEVNGTIKAYVGYSAGAGAFLRLGSGNYINIDNNGVLKFTNNHVIWHAGNDGAGSGLDADLLDGYHENSFYSGYLHTPFEVSKCVDHDAQCRWRKAIDISLTPQSYGGLTIRGEIWYEPSDNKNDEIRKYPFCIAFNVNSNTDRGPIIYLTRACKELNVANIRVIRTEAYKYEVHIQPHPSMRYNDMYLVYQVQRNNISQVYTNYSQSTLEIGTATATWGKDTASILTEDVTSAAYTLATSRTIWGQSFDGSANVGGVLSSAAGIEFNGGGSSSNNGGFIDFHYNASSSDHTSRIIEDGSGRLDINYTLYALYQGNVGIGTYSPTQKLQVAGTIYSSAAQGTAPFKVDSTTLVTNLNADLLDGREGSGYLKHYTYSIPASKGVRITYAAYASCIITAGRSNSNGQLVLIGSGYGETGDTRNKFTQLVDCATGMFTWSLPNTSSLSCCVEIMHNSTSGAATVQVESSGTITFTEITALTSPAKNYTLLNTANYNTYVPKLDGTGATGTWGISITGNAASATKLETARTLWGQSFNGTADIGTDKYAKMPYLLFRTVTSGSDATIGYVGRDSNSNTINLKSYTGFPVSIGSGQQDDIYITTGHNVGIGTTNPSEKVHVAGNILANGNIVANGGVAAKGIASLGGGAGTANPVTQINIGNTPYTPTNGIVSLPAYPTWSTLSGKPTAVSAFANDSGYISGDALAVTFSSTTLTSSSTSLYLNNTVQRDTLQKVTISSANAYQTFTLNLTGNGSYYGYHRQVLVMNNSGKSISLSLTNANYIYIGTYEWLTSGGWQHNDSNPIPMDSNNQMFLLDIIQASSSEYPVVKVTRMNTWAD